MNDVPERYLRDAVKGLPLIGRGAFSKVYSESAKTVLIISRDPVKECLSLGRAPQSSRLPRLEKLEHDGIFGLYRSEKYNRVSSLKSELDKGEYELYKKLKQLQASQGDTELRKLIQKSNLHHSHKKLLIDTVEAIMNFDYNIRFEISPRNVAVRNGELVLLDCFYIPSLLKGHI